MFSYFKRIAILILVCLFYSFSPLSASGQGIPASSINVTQIIESQAKLDANYGLVIDFWKEYIQNKGIDTGVEIGELPIKTFTKGLLFPEWLRDSDYDFHLMSIKKTGLISYEIKTIMKRNLTNRDNGKNEDFYFYIYNAKIIFTPQKKYVDYNLRTEMYTYKVDQNISYYLPKEFDIKKFDSRNAHQYCDSIAHLFDMPSYSYPLKYFVTNLSDAFNMFGFDYSIESTGRFLKKMDILISVNTSTFDKHELCHAVLKNNEFPMFLNEGIAVYLGGSQNLSYGQTLWQFKTKTWNTLPDSTKSQWIEKYLKNDNAIMVTAEYSNFYYAVSGLLIEKIVTKSGIKQLSSILKGVSNKDTPLNFFKHFIDIDEKKMAEYIDKS